MRIVKEFNDLTDKGIS